VLAKNRHNLESKNSLALIVHVDLPVARTRCGGNALTLPEAKLQVSAYRAPRSATVWRSSSDGYSQPLVQESLCQEQKGLKYLAKDITYSHKKVSHKNPAFMRITRF
jgi:hypothetical protein